MDKNAAKVLEDLRQDHKNMSLLLNLLELESNRLFDGEQTDFELLEDIMHYMTVYPDVEEQFSRLFASVQERIQEEDL